MGRSQTTGIGGTAFHQRQRLQHLGRRARQNNGVGITPCLNNLAIGAADHRVATMQALQKIATPDFNQWHCCCHLSLSSMFRENPPIGLSLLATFALM
jgi:hypothetical protein